jgi:hypothetical protein
MTLSYLLRKIHTQKKRLLASVLVVVLSMPWYSAVAFFGLFGSNNEDVSPVSGVSVVSMLIQEELLENATLKNLIDQYALNVQQKTKAKVVQVPVPQSASALDIFEGNAHIYFSGINNDGRSRLIGTILIGNVPLPIVEKQGSLYPSIFPYTDFKNPSFEWNPKINRFQFVGGDSEPEIWHGVIRSDSRIQDTGNGNDSDIQEAQERDLLQYFIQNNRAHNKAITFGKQVFNLNLPDQKQGLDPMLRHQYDQYMNYIEDVMYLRYNKHWVRALFEESETRQDIPWDFLPSNVRPKNELSIEDQTEHLIDVTTKYQIETELKRYTQAWENWLKTQIDARENAQRWTASDIQTTIDLVAQKDLVSSVFLKGINDTMEIALQEAVETYNIPTSVSVPTVTDIFFTGDDQNQGVPLEWNEVDRASLTTEDCTLIRGNVRTEEHPFSQMTLDGEEIFEGDQGAAGCKTIITRDNEDDNITHRFDSLMIHDEPRPETIREHIESMQINAIPVDDPRGFSFYDHSLQWQRVDFLNLFDYLDLIEPTMTEAEKNKVKTIMLQDAQQKIQDLNTTLNIANAQNMLRLNTDKNKEWPVSKCVAPTGYGCFNANGDILNSDSCRSYTRSQSQIDSFTTRIQWNETCTWNQPLDPSQTLAQAETIVRYYEVGTLLEQNILQNILYSFDLDRIIDNMIWLKTDLQDKNDIVLDQIFSSKEEVREFFFDTDFDGFEVVEIKAEKEPEKEGKSPAWNGGFEQGETEDAEYVYFEGQDDFVIISDDPIEYSGIGADELFSDENSESGKPIRVVIDPETGAKEIFQPSDHNEFLDTPRSMRATPIFVEQASANKNPIEMTVQLLNRANQTVRSDFETEVELVFVSGNPSGSFTISPSQKQTVEQGQATWYLYPTQDPNDSEFEIQIQTDDLKSQTIPIQLFDSSVELYLDSESVLAGDETGVRVQGRMLNDKKEKSQNMMENRFIFHLYGDLLMIRKCL